MLSWTVLAHFKIPHLQQKQSILHFVLFFSPFILRLTLAIYYITSGDRALSSGPAHVLFWAPVQVLENRNESGEQQNLGQGLQVFKCTIGALTWGQEEFKKMVCRLLKHLKRENVANLPMNRTISVLTKLQLLETNKTRSEDWHDCICRTTKHNMV